MLEKHSAIAVARRLHRSVTSVIVKSKRLGISRRMRSGWYSKAEVGEILGVHHRWVQARIDDGRLKASYHHGERPGQGGMRMWHVEQKDLRAYIRRHPEELQGRNVDMFSLVEVLTGVDYA